MIHIIRVDTLENLINDLCSFLRVSQIELCNKIFEMYSECQESEHYYFDDEKFFDLSCDFISKNNNEKIEEVYLCHLIRSIDCPEQLYPLHEVLTTKNALSDFLSEKGFSFKTLGQKIKLVHNGREYSESELGTPLEDNNYHGHLAVRFGYGFEPDFCLNGFLFAINPQKSTDGYYYTLKRGPEILQDLDRYFGTNLSSQFYELSNYYFALMRVRLNKIIFDEKQYTRISHDRTKLFLDLCFQAIYNLLYIDKNSGITNPMIRLTDAESAIVETYIQI